MFMMHSAPVAAIILPILLISQIVGAAPAAKVTSTSSTSTSSSKTSSTASATSSATAIATVAPSTGSNGLYGTNTGNTTVWHVISPQHPNYQLSSFFPTASNGITVSNPSPSLLNHVKPCGNSTYVPINIDGSEFYNPVCMSINNVQCIQPLATSSNTFNPTNCVAWGWSSTNCGGSNSQSGAQQGKWDTASSQFIWYDPNDSTGTNGTTDGSINSITISCGSTASTS